MKKKQEVDIQKMSQKTKLICSMIDTELHKSHLISFSKLRVTNIHEKIGIIIGHKRFFNVLVELKHYFDYLLRLLCFRLDFFIFLLLFFINYFVDDPFTSHLLNNTEFATKNLQT